MGAILINQPPQARTSMGFGQHGMTTVHRWKPVDQVDYALDRAHKFLTWDEWNKFAEKFAKDSECLPQNRFSDPHLYTMIRNDTYPNGQLHQLIEARTGHNDVKNLMLYREVKYMTYETSTEPFTYIWFTSAGDPMGIACANGAITKTATTAYFSATATYTNSTGGNVTITEIHLLNANATPAADNEYADYIDATFPQIMADGETMGVTWTHTWTGGANVYTHLTEATIYCTMAGVFAGINACLPIAKSWLVDVGTYETNNRDLAVYTGGGPTDTSTTWRATHTQSSGDYTIDRVSSTSSTATTYDETGKVQCWAVAAEGWTSGDSKTIQIVGTWTVT